MNAPVSAPPPSAALRPADPVQPDPPTVYWWVTILDEVESTQQAAAGQAPWSAVLALRQTGGRGQRQRSFVSDVGGFYLTAVVPFDGDAAGWRGFALAIGRAVVGALTDLGIADLRLRWPNDLMIGHRKVGGILVEQDGRDTLLVGLGLNITNQPWLEDTTLRYAAGRLLDHSDRALTGPEPLVDPILRAIRQAHEEFSIRRLGGMIPELNRCWGVRRHVRLEAVPEITLPLTEGVFAGLDDGGRVQISRPDGSTVSVPEHHIQRLVEVE